MTDRDTRDSRLPISVLVDLVSQTKAKGASEADVLLEERESFEVEVRLGCVDKVKRSLEHRIGLRVFYGKSSAVCSTSDLARDSLARLVEETARLARATAAEDASGLPEPGRLGRGPDPAIFDDEGFGRSERELTLLAMRAEQAALDYDSAIKNSEGSGYQQERVRKALASTSGFAEEYEGTRYMLYAAPIARRGEAMQRDWWISDKRRFGDLDRPESVGREAARRALRRLGAARVKTGRFPVVFDNRTAASLVDHLAGALSGGSLVKRASFLLGKLGKRVAAPAVTLIDDPTLRHGLASRPFDGEGLQARKTEPIRDGVLESYLLDSYAGRRLGLEPTGSANRDPSGAPSAGPSNLYLAPGDAEPEEIIAGVKSGFYVTELIGFGFNPVTGDYSRGAAGLWIEDGCLTRPVEEITIAGNLSDMLLAVAAVGKDLEFHEAIASPTVLIENMTIAGD